MNATERLWRTESGRIVRESDPDAKFLAYAIGDELPEHVAAQFADPEPEPEKKSGAKTSDKAADKPADKAAHKPSDK